MSNQPVVLEVKNLKKHFPIKGESLKQPKATSKPSMAFLFPLKRMRRFRSSEKVVVGSRRPVEPFCVCWNRQKEKFGSMVKIYMILKNGHFGKSGKIFN